MSKGSGGSSAAHSAGGVGGRGPAGGLSPGAKRALVILGALGVGLATDASARRGAKLLGDAAASKIAPVTKAMRDKVRTWAIERASKARGDIQTEGIAMAAARAALNGQAVLGANPKQPGDWRAIPDGSVFSTRTGNYRGRDVKSLVRTAVDAGKNHIANAPQLEASTAPRYEDKARKVTAALKKPRRAKGKKKR